METPSQRIGKFSIPRRMIDDKPDLVKAAMADVIVVRAELMWHLDAIEYVGLSPAFDAVDEGFEPPYYVAEFWRGENGDHFTRWVRA